MPREGLKPGAVVEEGGKPRAGKTPLERAGGAWESGLAHTRTPRPRLYLL